MHYRPLICCTASGVLVHQLNLHGVFYRSSVLYMNSFLVETPIKITQIELLEKDSLDIMRPLYFNQQGF
jgi:hypothetical protein